jgi:hypothetical protein
MLFDYRLTYDLEWKDPEPEIVEGHTLACKRYPVRKLMAYDANGNLDEASPRNLLPLKYVQSLERNQKLATCCRHPENHEIEAWYSSEADRQKGVPDIYINHCTCGRRHVRFCVGGDNPVTGEKDFRPFWEVR